MIDDLSSPPCESFARVNGKLVHCDRPWRHTGSHYHEEMNLVVGWENHG